MLKDLIQIGKRVFNKEAAKEVIAFEENRIRRYQECFETEAGKYVLADLSAKLDSPSYKEGVSFDSVAYREGIKNALRGIIETVNYGDEALKQFNQLKQEIIKYERNQQHNQRTSSNVNGTTSL